MATAFNIPVSIPQGTGAHTISLAELKEKVQSYVDSLHITIRVSENSSETVSARATDHTDWVKKMAQYRILEPVDDKEALLEALDERYR